MQVLSMMNEALPCRTLRDRSRNADAATKRHPLVLAVEANNISALLGLSNTPEWYKFIEQSTGNSLLHIAILKKAKEIFDYILSIEEFPLEHKNKEDRTAMDLCFYHMHPGGFEHYACELLKKGVKLDFMFFLNFDSLLHYSVFNGLSSVAKALMALGDDVNSQNYQGTSPIWMCLHAMLDERVTTEIVTALLYYGADPTLGQPLNYNAFEFAAMVQLPSGLLETLFDVMFDHASVMEVHIEVLLVLAEMGSDLFPRALKHANDVIVTDSSSYCIHLLFAIEVEDLDLLIKKCPAAIREILSDFSRGDVTRCCSFGKSCLNNITRLLESDLMEDLLDVMRNFNDNFLLELPGDGSLVIGQICFFLSYGLELNEFVLDRYYKRFGFGELLSIVIHMRLFPVISEMDIKRPLLWFLSDIQWDFEQVLSDVGQYCRLDVSKLLHHFSHWKLRAIHGGDRRPEIKSIIAKQPDVPLLQELARNSFRKFFIKTCEIKTAGQFYMLVDKLPIALKHKKIITLDDNLY